MPPLFTKSTDLPLFVDCCCCCEAACTADGVINRTGFGGNGGGGGLALRLLPPPAANQSPASVALPATGGEGLVGGTGGKMAVK